MKRIPLHLLAGLALLVASGCARHGNIGLGNTAQLLREAASLPNEDPARLGRYAVHAEGFAMNPGFDSFPVVTYRPVGYQGYSPAVVFLPGRFSPEDEYEGYARLLASRGYVVVVRGRYSWWHPDAALVAEAGMIADWLAKDPWVDATRIGVAGHSMGACDSIAAAGRDTRFRAVVAIEPGGPDSPRVIRRVVPKLKAPLLIIGAELATNARAICGKKETNYERYFEHSPDGTVELEIRGADHLQVMDDPDRFGMGMCRVGTADSKSVRTLARHATVAFFEQHLRGAEPMKQDFGKIAAVRVRGHAEPASAPHAAASQE
jgi:dienelactone hydrolase